MGPRLTTRAAITSGAITCAIWRGRWGCPDRNTALMFSSAIRRGCRTDTCRPRYKPVSGQCPATGTCGRATRLPLIRTCRDCSLPGLRNSTWLAAGASRSSCPTPCSIGTTSVDSVPAAIRILSNRSRWCSPARGTYTGCVHTSFPGAPAPSSADEAPPAGRSRCPQRPSGGKTGYRAAPTPGAMCKGPSPAPSRSCPSVTPLASPPHTGPDSVKVRRSSRGCCSWCTNSTLVRSGSLPAGWRSAPHAAAPRRNRGRTCPDWRVWSKRSSCGRCCWARSVLPYRVLPARRAVLPPEGETLLDGAHPHLDRYPGLADWWRRAEQLWLEHRSSNRLTLLDRLDFRHGLSGQLPVPPLRVVYGKAGMHVAAALVDDPRLIIDHTLYWGPVASRDEGLYLCAILNSPSLTELVRPLISYGKDETAPRQAPFGNCPSRYMTRPTSGTGNLPSSVERLPSTSRARVVGNGRPPFSASAAAV